MRGHYSRDIGACLCSLARLNQVIESPARTLPINEPAISFHMKNNPGLVSELWFRFALYCTRIANRGRGGLGIWIGREGLPKAGGFIRSEYPGFHLFTPKSILSPLRLRQRLVTHYSAAFLELKQSSRVAGAGLKSGSSWALADVRWKHIARMRRIETWAFASNTLATPGARWRSRRKPGYRQRYPGHPVAHSSDLQWNSSGTIHLLCK